MGQEIGAGGFCEEDFANFRKRLEQETALLRQHFADGTLSTEGPVIGLELEAWLIDHGFFPAAHNQSFLERMADPSVVAELSRFNIEVNAPIERLEGNGLKRMHAHLSETMRRCDDNANDDIDNVLAIGTLPTLRKEDLSLEAMTPSNRYAALNREAMRQRGGTPLEVHIDCPRGDEAFSASYDNVMLEAAATSVQLHLQLPPDQLWRAYNASVMLSAPIIAIAANSPFLFGKPLWAETRIPVFEQALQMPTGKPRVTLGEAYSGPDITEIFEENLRDYPVLLPVDAGEPARCFKCVHLQNGTIWRWVRPIVGFDGDGTPHVRLEYRVMPSGPSVLDMMANAAFYFGAVHALARDIEDFEAVLPFEKAKENFYDAARHGLDAEIHWMNRAGKRPVSEVIDDLLELAQHGLGELGMDREVIDHYLGTINVRLAAKRNGANWQLDHYEKYGDLHELTAAYLENQRSGRPVHEWPV